MRARAIDYEDRFGKAEGRSWIPVDHFIMLAEIGSEIIESLTMKQPGWSQDPQAVWELACTRGWQLIHKEYPL